MTRCLALITLLLAARLLLGDTVVLRSPQSDGPSYAVEGVVVDSTGTAVTLESTGTRKRRYPAERVVRIETDWPANALQARQSMAAKKWVPAADQYTGAIHDESRRWARRQLQTELMQCRCALGQAKRAGDLLLAIDAEDPQSPAWQWAPLPWYGSEEVSPSDASAWLDRREEAARLLGAAWLLHTARRELATTELRSLTRSGRENIAWLAETQLWRLRLMVADRRQTDRWAARLESMPPNLQPGPQHLMAQAYWRQKRYDEAALMALRAPLTGQAARRLAARGLLLAGRAMRAAKRNEEARRLLTELANEYRDTPWRQDAAQLLEP